MHEFTCTNLGRQIRAGERSPLEIVEQCFKQIGRLEDQVHAWVLLNSNGTRQQAIQLGEELAAGTDRGPLHGIPIAIKDIFDVAGWPTLAASPVRRGHLAQRDAEVVARLRRAGAIILGKTVTTEFASFDPPPTLNPWNRGRTPGGSSSGSAAAVASQMCPAALGSQTGGSITRPASFCGVAGCKPTYGEVSCDGVVALAPSMDHPGPIANTAKDLAILLAAMTDAPPAQTDSREKKSLGLLETFFMEVCEEPIHAATVAALERLKECGYSIEPVKIPSELRFPRVIELHRRIMAYEAGQYHKQNFATKRDQYGPQIASLIEEGLALPQAAYEEARAAQGPFRQQIEALLADGQLDALVLPATVTTAPSVTTTGDPRFNSLWSYGGVPTVSIPCALASDGLPASLQFVGAAGRTFDVLAVAAGCEDVLDFNTVPPIVSEVL